MTKEGSHYLEWFYPGIPLEDLKQAFEPLPDPRSELARGYFPPFGEKTRQMIIWRPLAGRENVAKVSEEEWRNIAEGTGVNLIDSSEYQASIITDEASLNRVFDQIEDGKLDLRVAPNQKVHLAAAQTEFSR